MKKFALPLILVLATTGCSYFQPEPKRGPPPLPKPVNYSYNGGDCNAQAENKLRLFDRPDTYPISPQERENARTALYNECMKAQGSQIASNPRSDTQLASQQDIATLSSLSPAAGGNAPAAYQNGAYPQGTVILLPGNNASQLASLSPSAGGNMPGGISTAYPNGATVVVVQAPGAQAPAPRPAPVMQQALARPIPVEGQKPVTQKPATQSLKAPTAAPTQATAPVQKLASAPTALPPTLPTAPKPAPVANTDPATLQLDRILSK